MFHKFFYFGAWLCLFFLLNTQSLNAQNLDTQSLYFMPKEQEKAFHHLINILKNSKNHLDIAIYSFTNREIAKAIRDTAKRGTKVRIIYDKSTNEKSQNSTIGYLAKLNNIEVCLLQGKASKNQKYFGLMHTKMAISDNYLVIGSANWSKSAFETNYETLFITQDSNLITKAKEEFNAMFKECEKY
ncbi:MAG: nuclease NucT [Helicobacter sp.]|nr:nuclease NucT [Helicobacter sp.]